MRIAVAVPEPHVTAPVLDAALEGVTRLDEELIRARTVPPFRQMADRVDWKPEPPGGEHFDHAGIVARRGWGDCDDLAPWHAASLRVTGEDPTAKAFARRSGAKRWHCLVRRSDGSIDDPSIEAGMPAPGAAVGIRGAAMPPMFRHGHSVSGVYQPIPHLALRPIQDRHGRPEAWQARTDLPWHWKPGESPTDVAMVSLHQSPISDQALVGACHGAIRLGEASGCSTDGDLDRLQAICDACEGASWEELAQDYGPDIATAAGHVVGSFFGHLTRKISRAVKHPGRIAKALATKVAPTALQFVPGVGPAASMALRAATPELQHLIKSGRHKHPKQRKHMHLTSPPLYSRADVLHAWDRWS
jgi:hypothetical protein